ncbi:2-oxoacid:acceptor oxidoreductase family protein, partial [Escherichia coli]|nr:2-oxoacid:acceptor oxidoreductase family protein [Escherichia coli]
PSPSTITNLLQTEHSNNIYIHHTYDNLVHGGVVLTDIRVSQKSIEAPYPVESADVVFVGEEKLLKEIAIVKGVKAGGKLI